MLAPRAGRNQTVCELMVAVDRTPHEIRRVLQEKYGEPIVLDRQGGRFVQYTKTFT